MTTHKIRVGDDFMKFKRRFKLELEAACPRKKFSDPEVTNMMAQMFGHYKPIKIGKKRVTYI